MKNKLFCLIGPSSTGKDTIKRKSGYPYVVSYRTREKRVGEIEGEDGYFITEEEFLKIDKSEWIAKTYYAGSYYGVKKKQLDQLLESDLLYVIDWEGVEYLKSKRPDIDLVSIYVDSDVNVLRERMINQGRKEEEINKRMKRIHLDLEAKEKCDYIIHNKSDINKAVDQLHAIIQKEKSCR